MVKKNVRALGVDDAPFEFSDEDVLVVGSVVRAPNYLEGLLSTKVEVDGDDANEKVIEMINDSRFKEQLRVIFTDGTAIGGFNLLDLSEIYQRTNIPVVSVARDEPDYDAIKKALKGHFEDWEERYEGVKEGELHEIETEYRPVYVQFEGLELKRVKGHLRSFTVRGRIPEPIRISHIVSSGIVRGESKGKP